MPRSPSYRLPAGAVTRLDALVDRIEAEPGDVIDVRQFWALQERVDARAVARQLPEGLTEEDFAGILRLAFLTECATETYGAAIEARAQRYGAAWLSRFNTRVWIPDELTHHTPYKLILMSLGFAEADLDRQVRETQEKAYVHYSGDLPVQVTTFGVIQEYLTDNWHGLIAKLMRPAAPEAAYMATRVKRRETLHTVWYRDMTALQIEAAPGLIEAMAHSMANFHMPGNALVPELQSQSARWLPLLGTDFQRIARDLLRLAYEMSGNPRRTGALIIGLAAEKGLSLGPISARHVKIALDRLGGPGYGLLGEALMERMGLDYMFRRQEGKQDSGYLSYDGVYEKIRGLLRSWLAQQVDYRFGPLDTGAAAP